MSRIDPHPPLSFPAGTPHSDRFGDVFKSRRGARDEARQVFVQAARVTDGWAGCDAYTVLELGFGLGVNFLHTVEAWQRDPRRSRRLFYVGVEAHPVSCGDLVKALQALDCLDLPDEVGRAAQRLAAVCV